MNAERAGVRASSVLPWLPWLLSAGIVLALFARALSFELLSWDDDLHLTANPHLRPLSAAGVARFWQAPYERLYIPVSYTFFAFEAAGSDWWHGADAPLDPVWFHGVSIALHLFNTLLVIGLLRRWGCLPWSAAAGGLIFAVHPMQVESVAWVSEQRGLLAAALALACCHSFTSASRAESRFAEWLSCLAATGWFILALLAKPTVVVVPVLLWIVQRTGLIPAARFQRAWWIGTLALGGGISLVTSHLQPPARLDYVLSRHGQLQVAVDALCWYFEQFVNPLREHRFSYGRSPFRAFSDYGASFGQGLIVAGVVGVLGIVRRRGGNALAAGGFWFLVALQPTLGWIPFIYQNYSTVADRYVYLPLVGAALGSAAWIQSGSRWRVGIVAGFLLLCGWGTWRDLTPWRSSESLYRHALAQDPDSGVAHFGLGVLAYRTGDADSAIDHFVQVQWPLQLEASARTNIGTIYFEQGNLEAAAHDAFIAAMIDSSDPRTLLLLAASLEALDRTAEARMALRGALHVGPGDPRVAEALGEAMLREGQTAEALFVLERLCRQYPRVARYHRLAATALRTLNRPGEAREALQRALNLEPTEIESLELLGQIHWEAGRLAAALETFTQATVDAPLDTHARRQSAASVQYQRGLLLIELQRVDEARAALEQARDLIPPGRSERDEIERLLNTLEPRQGQP